MALVLLGEGRLGAANSTEGLAEILSQSQPFDRIFKRNSFMQAHQERVVNEKKELDEKREKLGTFIEGKIFQTLSPEERNRLERQAIAMTTYSTILGERIAAFSNF